MTLDDLRNPQVPPSKKRDRDTVLAVREWMDFPEKPTAEDVANRLGISRRTFFRIVSDIEARRAAKRAEKRVLARGGKSHGRPKEIDSRAGFAKKKAGSKGK